MVRNKNVKLMSFLFLGACCVFPLSGCIINSQFGKEEAGGEIEEDYLLEITKKYDADFEKTSYTGGRCTIDFVHWDGDGASIERGVLNTMLKGFNRRYPEITVNLSILSDYEKQYSTKLAGTNIADVFLMPDGDVMSWAEIGGGKCEDLTSYVADSKLVAIDEMYESSVRRYQYDYDLQRCSESGKIIALPKDIGPTVMYYNKAAFQRYHVDFPDPEEPMTMDEAFAMWKKLTVEDGKGSKIMYGVGGISIEGLVWSAGGDFLNAERTAFPEDPVLYAGLKKGYEQLQRSYVQIEGFENCCVQPPASWTASSPLTNLFSNQMIACFIGLKSNVASFRKLTFDWDVCPVPSNRVEGDPLSKYKNAWSGSVGYSMFNGSKHKEAAWKLIEYIASKEGQEIMSATGFQIPVYPKLAEQEDFIAREQNNRPANFKAFLSAAKYQPVGLWSYHRNQLWKTEGYDKDVEGLLSEKEPRLTVDGFLQMTKPHVNEKLKL